MAHRNLLESKSSIRSIKHDQLGLDGTSSNSNLLKNMVSERFLRASCISYERPGKFDTANRQLHKRIKLSGIMRMGNAMPRASFPVEAEEVMGGSIGRL
jgi:hypothetical protein